MKQLTDEFTESGFEDRPVVHAPPLKDANGDNISKNVENEINKQLKESAPEAAKAVDAAKEEINEIGESVNEDLFYEQLKEMVDNAFMLIAELAGDENLKNTPAETETLARILYRYSPVLKREIIDSFQFLLVIGKKLIRARATLEKIMNRHKEKEAPATPQ